MAVFTGTVIGVKEDRKVLAFVPAMFRRLAMEERLRKVEMGSGNSRGGLQEEARVLATTSVLYRHAGGER